MNDQMRNFLLSRLSSLIVGITSRPKLSSSKGYPSFFLLIFLPLLSSLFHSESKGFQFFVPVKLLPPNCSLKSILVTGSNQLMMRIWIELSSSKSYTLNLISTCLCNSVAKFFIKPVLISEVGLEISQRCPGGPLLDSSWPWWISMFI